MSKTIPHVDEYMTPGPHSIGREQSLAHAHHLMRAHRIRHLPVLSAGKLVGVISNSDLHLVETLSDVDPDKVSVEEAMTPIVYTVAPEASLEEVAREMARHKYGCAVVEDKGKVVGVFTTIDAMRALVDSFDNRVHH